MHLGNAALCTKLLEHSPAAARKVFARLQRAPGTGRRLIADLAAEAQAVAAMPVHRTPRARDDDGAAAAAVGEPLKKRARLLVRTR